jgi:uncharacterized membrane protein
MYNTLSKLARRIMDMLRDAWLVAFTIITIALVDSLQFLTNPANWDYISKLNQQTIIGIVFGFVILILALISTIRKIQILDNKRKAEEEQRHKELIKEIQKLQK